MSTYSQPSFFSSTWKTGGVWTCTLGVISQEWLKIEVKLLFNANIDSYMPCLVQWMTLSDLEWLFHGSALPCISVVAELLVLCP